MLVERNIISLNNKGIVSGMVDKQRMEFVEFWAEKCKKNMASCLAETTPFINSQIISANDFYKRLAQTPNGKEKIKELKG